MTKQKEIKLSFFNMVLEYLEKMKYYNINYIEIRNKDDVKKIKEMAEVFNYCE